MARNTLETAINWKPWADSTSVPFKSLISWERDSKRKFHCSFCKDHGSFKHFSVPLPSKPSQTVFCCPKCHEYKGLEPCIPGHCFCGEF